MGWSGGGRLAGDRPSERTSEGKVAEVGIWFLGSVGDAMLILLGRHEFHSLIGSLGGGNITWRIYGWEEFNKNKTEEATILGSPMSFPGIVYEFKIPWKYRKLML